MTNCDTVSLRVIADFHRSETANALTRANQTMDMKIVSYIRARDMPQAKMLKIDLKQFPGFYDIHARRMVKFASRWKDAGIME